MKLLYKIDSPKDIQRMSFKELKLLSEEIREYLNLVVPRQGGHLSSNLGIVELTIALLRSFELPVDKVFYDCGHQSYVHKILTGRKVQFDKLREYGGISGFQDMKESVYDVYSGGHTSNSLSVAMGMALGRKAKKEKHYIVPVIGDGSLTGGLAHEALNNIAESDEKIIIVLNDNGMSITQNKTAVSKFRTSRSYKGVKSAVKKTKHIPLVGRITYGGSKVIRNVVKEITVGKNFFQSLGVEYIGPINGHNIKEIEEAMEKAKVMDKSVVVHVLTEKGQGNELAMKDPFGKYHGVAQVMNKTLTESEEIDSKKLVSWSQAISNIVELNMKLNHAIQVITPAMMSGSCLVDLKGVYPERVHDVGIAEQHALSLASGMALSGLRPFVSIYSSFLQRGYDQLVHDIARLNLPVMVGIDRAGLSARDGASHHGLLDIAMIKSIPNFILCQPKDYQEARELIKFGIEYDGPFAIRYERGKVYEEFSGAPKTIALGSWTIERNLKAPDAYFICYGNDVDYWKVKFEDTKKNVEVVNARFIVPMDTIKLSKILNSKKPVFVLDKAYKDSGLCDSVKTFVADEQSKNEMIYLGFDKKFITHGSKYDLLKESKLDTQSILKEVDRVLKKKKK